MYALGMKIELLEQLRIECAEIFCHEAVQAVEVLKERVETEKFLHQLVVVSFLPSVDCRYTWCALCHGGIEVVYRRVADDSTGT